MLCVESIFSNENLSNSVNSKTPHRQEYIRLSYTNFNCQER